MIYIDCGYYNGVAMRLNCARDGWTVYAFEANPKVEVPDFVSRQAVWTKSGKVKLTQHALRDDSASIEGTSGQAPNMEQILVPCFDFSEFVSNLPNDKIVCSMDIEGAEFEVLRKMLKDDTALWITFLDIEFHHRLMLEETAETAQEIIDQLQELGVIVRLKVEL